MRRLLVPVLLVSSACGSVFDLERLPDAPTGHDDDGDGHPDSVDVCPGLPSASTVDSDDDGIGDDCDPSPGVPDQRQGRLLELAGTELPSWTAMNGAWSPEPSAFVQGSLMPAPARLTKDESVSAPPWTAELAFEPITIGALPDAQEVGLYLDDAGPAERYLCGVVNDAGVWRATFGSPGLDVTEDVGLTIEIGRRYTIQLTVLSPTAAMCRIHDGERWYETARGAGGTVPTVLTLEDYNATVRFFSVAFYDAAL